MPTKPQNAFLPQLTAKERLLACVVFNALGYVLQIGSTTRLFTALSSGQTGSFALIYSLGNILSLVGIMFLVGFKEHCTQIAQKERRCSSIVFFGSMGLSLLIPAVSSGKAGNVVTAVCVLAQMVSYWYYIFTYVPCGQQICNRLLFTGLGLQQRPQGA